MSLQPMHDATVALPSITGSDMSASLHVLQEFASGVETAMRAVAPLVYTPSVPVHHWPMPQGETLRSFPNPMMKHPRETDEDYRRRQEIAIASAAGVLLRGVSIGVPPAVALEQMFNIRGKLGMFVKAKLALATARGVKAWDVELTDETATCAGIHPLTGDTVTITVTMADARRAGWVSGNDNYTKNPKDMLWSRSMGRVLDRVAGHILFGLASVDELHDEPEPTPVTSRVTVDDLPTAPAPAPAPAAITPAPAPDPVPVPEVAVEQAVPAPDPEKLRRAMGDLFARLKVSGPGARGRRALVCSELVGRPVTSAAEMTAAELQMVLDNLTADTLRRIEEQHAAQAAAEAAPEPAPAPAGQEWPPVAPVPAGDPWGPREYADDYDPNGDPEDGQL